MPGLALRARATSSGAAAVVPLAVVPTFRSASAHPLDASISLEKLVEMLADIHAKRWTYTDRPAP
jgi:hypothetical protein